MRDGHVHIQGKYNLETIDEIVAKCIKEGIDEIWLLDHTYYFNEFEQIYLELININKENEKWVKKKCNRFLLKEYCDFITLVRSKNYPIKIRFGLEVCYYKKFEELIKNVCNSFDFDFILGSIHTINGFDYGRNPEKVGEYNINEIYKTYFENSIDLVNSNLFDVITHPDVIKKLGINPTIDLVPYYERLTDVILEKDMYIEQNSGLSRKKDGNEVGMNTRLLEIAINKGLKIMTSSDAHYICDIGDKINIMQLEIDKLQAEKQEEKSKKISDNV